MLMTRMKARVTRLPPLFHLRVVVGRQMEVTEAVAVIRTPHRRRHPRQCGVPGSSAPWWRSLGGAGGTGSSCRGSVNGGGLATKCTALGSWELCLSLLLSRLERRDCVSLVDANAAGSIYAFMQLRGITCYAYGYSILLTSSDLSIRLSFSFLCPPTHVWPSSAACSVFYCDATSLS